MVAKKTPAAKKVKRKSPARKRTPRTSKPAGDAKQVSSTGRQLRAAMALRNAMNPNAPGQWASDHRLEAFHINDWSYIAIRAICLQALQAEVNVFDDAGPTGAAKRRLRQFSRKRLRLDPIARIQGRDYWKLKALYGAEETATDPLSNEHPLMRLMINPAPRDSGGMFRYRQIQQLQSTGVCLVWNRPNQLGRTVERYVIPTGMAVPYEPTTDYPRGYYRIEPTSLIQPFGDADGYIETTGLQQVLGTNLSADEVQAIRWPHPLSINDGLSPMSAGARLKDTSDQVNTARWAQLQNAGEPSIVITLDEGVDPTQEELDAAIAKLTEKYGGALNHKKIMVMVGGREVTTLSTSPKDMDYKEAHLQLRDAELALHGTPPVAAGIQEAGAFAAYYASIKQFQCGTCQPIFDVLAESDTIWFTELRAFGNRMIREYPESLMIEMEAVSIDDPDLIERQLQTDGTLGTRTKDEVRSLRGLPLWGGEKGEAIAGETPAPAPLMGLRPEQEDESESVTGAEFPSIDLTQKHNGNGHHHDVPHSILEAALKGALSDVRTPMEARESILSVLNGRA